VQVTLRDLERHFEQISIDVTSTPEIVLAATFANALLAMHTHSNGGGYAMETAVENASQDRLCPKVVAAVVMYKPIFPCGTRTCRIQLLGPFGNQQHHQQQVWTVPRYPPQSCGCGLDTTHCSANAYVDVIVRHGRRASSFCPAEKATVASTPQKLKPAAAAALVIYSLFPEWRQTQYSSQSQPRILCILILS
jgi:hypothetical protein